jgi:hypothetical protein
MSHLVVLCACRAHQGCPHFVRCCAALTRAMRSPMSWASIGASAESAVLYLPLSITRSRSDASAAHDAATVSAGSRGPAARAAICGPAARGSVKCSRRMPRASRVTSRATSALSSALTVVTSAAVSVACRSRRISSASLSSRRRCSRSAARSAILWAEPYRDHGRASYVSQATAACT